MSHHIRSLSVPRSFGSSLRILLLGAAISVPSPASAQSPFHAARLVPRADSFAILVQGTPRGFMREAIVARDGGFRLVSRQVLGTMIEQDTEVDFTATLQMQDVRQRGTARGQAMKIEVRYAQGRATGSATTPGPQGMNSLTVDAELPNGAVDDNVLMALLPTLTLDAGRRYEVPVFASGKGSARTVTLEVGALEKVTVLAGTFDAHPIVMTGGDAPVTFHVSALPSPRVVRMTMPGSPLSFELASR